MNEYRCWYIRINDYTKFIRYRIKSTLKQVSKVRACHASKRELEKRNIEKKKDGKRNRKNCPAVDYNTLKRATNKQSREFEAGCALIDQSQAEILILTIIKLTEPGAQWVYQQCILRKEDMLESGLALKEQWPIPLRVLTLKYHGK
jgi:hypothetical protein